MTILPAAMRIQDDIPLVLGRRKSPDPAAIREIHEAVAKVVAVQDFECKRHELSEVPVEVAAKPSAGGWIPWDGKSARGPAGYKNVLFRCGEIGEYVFTWDHSDQRVLRAYQVVAWR